MTRLKDALEAMANEGHPSGAGEVLRGARHRATSRGRRPGARHRALVSAVVVATLIAVTVAGVVVAVRNTNGDSPRVATPPRAAQSTPETRNGSGFETLDPGPLSTRSDVALVWTGRELVAWGGDLEATNLGIPGPNEVFTDGAFYDPRSRRWQTMSGSPLPATPDTPVGVWGDGEAFFFRGQAAAAWDPERNEWRSLPDAPGEAVTAAVWTGQEVVTLPNLAALDPRNGEWRRLPDPPVTLERPVAQWTGDEFLVVGRGGPAGDVQGMGYDPDADRWSELPTSGMNAQAIDAAWNGHELVVVNYDMSAAAYEPAGGRWRPLPSVPARFYEWYPRVVTAGDHVVVFMAQTVAVLGPDDEWTPLPYHVPGAPPASGVLPTSGAISTGDLVFLFGFASEARENRFAVLDADEALHSATIQVGAVTVALPSGFEFRSASFERGDPRQPLPPPETVTGEFTSGTGTCFVLSTYVGSFGGSALDVVTGGRDEPLTIEPVDGSAPWEGRTGFDPQRSIVRLDSSDLIEVSCSKARQARKLARYLSPPP